MLGTRGLEQLAVVLLDGIIAGDIGRQQTEGEKHEQHERADYGRFAAAQFAAGMFERFPAATQRECDPGERHVNIQHLLLR
jgi:hypothetical protein